MVLGYSILLIVLACHVYPLLIHLPRGLAKPRGPYLKIAPHPNCLTVKAVSQESGKRGVKVNQKRKKVKVRFIFRM